MNNQEQSYMSNASEMMLIKQQLKKEIELDIKRSQAFEKGEKKLIKTGLHCYWCKKNDKESEITNEMKDCYYECHYHSNKFCHKCAWNFYKGEIERDEAPKCAQDPFSPAVDCILEKKEII